MAEVHHIAFGWINPAMACVLAFLGSLLGLALTARARETSGGARARWLALAAVAIGGTGIWLMQFMAMLGFDVPGTLIRFDTATTVGSMLVAIAGVAVGLFVVGMGRPNVFKLLLGGLLTGLGLAAMHYTAVLGLRLGGEVLQDRPLLVISAVMSISVATIALWFAQNVHGGAGTVSAAAIMSVAVCAMHYSAMTTIRVQLDPAVSFIRGVDPLSLLVPVIVLSCLIVTALAYSTVGLSMDRESAEAEEQMDMTRELTWPLISIAALRLPPDGRRLAADADANADGNADAAATADGKADADADAAATADVKADANTDVKAIAQGNGHAEFDAEADVAGRLRAVIAQTPQPEFAHNGSSVVRSEGFW